MGMGTHPPNVTVLMPVDDAHAHRAAAMRLDRTRWDTRRIVAKWLVHCADPLGPQTAPPRRALSPAEAAELVTQAEAHGVLPAVLRHFQSFDGNDPAFAAVKADALARHRSALAYALMLRRHGEALAAAAAELPVAVIKGPVFAKLLYPAASFRPFTDIDVLVAADAVARVSALLAAHGFMLAEQAGEPDRREWKWVHRDNDAVMVEVQTDLVHAPSMSNALSLTYDDIRGIADTPAAQLIVAVIHSSAGAPFDRLRHAVDICQGARMLITAEDERRFEDLVSRTGARLAAQTGLFLAGRLFAVPRCIEIANALGPPCYAGAARFLVSEAVVTSTMTPMRYWHSWRRQAFRKLLMRQARP